MHHNRISFNLDIIALNTIIDFDNMAGCQITDMLPANYYGSGNILDIDPEVI